MIKTFWLTDEDWDYHSDTMWFCSECVISYEVKDFEYDPWGIFACEVCVKNTAKCLSSIEEILLPVGVYDD